MSNERINALIDQYHLTPHPEGGYYSEQYRSESLLSSPINGGTRASISHIYFLLTVGQLSRWHKVLHDEIWNVYEGAPLRILTFDGQSAEDKIIGGCEGSSEPRDFFTVVKGGRYQAAQSTGHYTLVGCSVAPGFEFSDFSYVEDESLKRGIIALGKDYAKFL